MAPHRTPALRAFTPRSVCLSSSDIYLLQVPLVGGLELRNQWCFVMWIASTSACHIWPFECMDQTFRGPFGQYVAKRNVNIAATVTNKPLHRACASVPVAYSRILWILPFGPRRSSVVLWFSFISAWAFDTKSLSPISAHQNRGYFFILVRLVE